jgi:Type II restriction enzyme MunI
MGTLELKKRKIWQDISGGRAGVAEKNIYQIFLDEFKGSDFRIRARPKEFKNIYTKIVLSQEVLAGIYNPDETWIHGLIPDYAIDNVRTKKTLYVETKRQDGWVEGTLRSAGRGNAHERSNKLFTPGLLKLMREYGRLDDNVLPFLVVFQGDIARDPKRVREIHYWYGEYTAHFFLWSKSSDAKSLIDHFNKKLKYLLL